MLRVEKRKIINRKGFDYQCPVDIEVVKILHEYAIANNLDKEVVAADMSLDTIKKIRKDVFKSIPDIIDQCIIDAEIIN